MPSCGGHSNSRPTAALHATFDDPEQWGIFLHRDLSRLSTSYQDEEVTRSKKMGLVEDEPTDGKTAGSVPCQLRDSKSR